MKHILHKYCLTVVFKKKEKERKDGMPKKHDPKKRKRERKDGMPKKHDPIK